VPRLGVRWFARIGVAALAGAAAAPRAQAQAVDAFTPALDAGSADAAQLRRTAQPSALSTQRFSMLPQPPARAAPAPPADDDADTPDLPLSAPGPTGFDSTYAARKARKKKAAGYAAPPPQLSPAEAATAREIARGPQQLYARSVVLPPPGEAATATQIVPVHRRPRPDVDPYAPVGVRAGSFTLFPAVELSGGYTSNPLAIPNGPGAGEMVVSPELKVQSEWTRHELKAELRGSYYAYSRTFDSEAESQVPLDCGCGGTTPELVSSGVPRKLDRPDFNGVVNGRYDTYGRSHIDAEGRFTVGTDNPGSPNIAAGLDHLPVYTRVGGSLGYTQNFNRLDVAVKGGADRITYQDSTFTDGSTASNDDRDFNQYSGSLRASYEVFPDVTPFAQVDVDQRVHDLAVDRNGLRRDSTGLTWRVGSTFRLTHELVGEASAGYTTRDYDDPTLPKLSGLVADASLIWTASALTTVTLTAKSATDESIVADVSGALRRDVSLEVDHAFRRWLVGSLSGGYGFDTYVASGPERQDQRFFTAAALVYKMSREWQVKGEVRRDWLTSNISGVGYDANTFLVGVRWQR